MPDDDQPKAGWVARLPNGEPFYERLARTVYDDTIGDRDEKIDHWLNQDPGAARLEGAEPTVCLRRRFGAATGANGIIRVGISWICITAGVVMTLYGLVALLPAY